MKLDEMMEKDGFVAAAKIAEAIGRTLPTVHRRIEQGKIPGRQVEGRYWYVDLHAYLADSGLPKESGAYALLKELAKTVRRPQPKK